MMPSFTIYLYVEEYYVKELRMKKKTSKTYYQWGRNEIFLGEDLFNKKFLKLQIFS